MNGFHHHHQGFVSRRLAAQNPRPYWLHLWTYILSFFCLLSWPYRIVLELNSCRSKVHGIDRHRLID